MTHRWQPITLAVALLAAPSLALAPTSFEKAGEVDSIAPVRTSPTPAAADSQRYASPIDIPPAMSATFAEYRPGHFHAGVDFSTNGREGVPVRAIADGSVVRVRASGLGYGRAIYVQLRDGRLAVYAHLSAFMPPLADYVAAVQDSLGRYRVDLTPPPGRFRVTRGQVVGRSGSSGAGGPHFHFEMREADIAINPLSHGVDVPDPHPPRVFALFVIPLDAATRVNGLPSRFRAPLVARPGDGLGAAAEITIEGRVGLSLQGYDQATAAGDNHLGIYHLELVVDGEQIFASRYDRFDYLRNHEVEAQYDYEEVIHGRRSVQNLFVPPGVTGDFYGGLSAGAGMLRTGSGPAAQATFPGERMLTPGTHALKIVAADAAGNRVEAAAVLRALEPQVASGDSTAMASASPGAAARAPRLTLSPEGRTALLDLDFGAPLSSPPALRLGGRTLAMTPLGGGRYRTRLDATGESPLAVVARLEGAGAPTGEWNLDLPWIEAPRAQAGKGMLAGGRVLAQVPKSAFFEDAYVWAAPILGNGPAWPKGLVPQSPIFQLEPASLPQDQGLWLGLLAAPSAATEAVGLYRFDGEEWTYEGSDRRPAADGTWIGADVKRFSRFALARDIAAPVVEWREPPLVVTAGAATQSRTTGPRPPFRARVRDDGSGFREDDLTFIVDGKRVPTEWDPDAGEIRYEPRAPLAAGRHVLIAEAKDRAGLVTRRERAITVR
jgi:hypothetical protein